MHLLLLGAMACGEDPILKKVREDKEKAAQADAAGASAAGKPATGTPPEGRPPPGAGTAKAGIPEPPKPGIPVQPAPGRPDEPPPASAGDPQLGTAGTPGPGMPTPPAPGRPAEQQVPKVAVTGSVSFPGWKAGQVRVSAFDGPHAEHAGAQPRIIGEVRLEKPGDFQMEVPQGAGAVYIEAAVDEDGDGRPGPLDPQGNADAYPVQVDQAAVADIRIHLSRRDPPPGAPRKDDF